MRPPEGFLGMRAGLDILVYWSLLGVCQGITNFRQSQQRERHAAEMEARLTRSKLQALRMQINPHFLFNTLNAISTLIYVNPRAADEMIGDLSELLRRSSTAWKSRKFPWPASFSSSVPISVSSKNALVIASAWSRTCRMSLMNALVPALILQPLVENAIRHGIEPQRAPGLVTIEAKRHGENLHLVVRDNGKGPPAGDANRPEQRGVGLANTQARLQGLYGQNQQFSFGKGEPRGCTVEVRLPFHTETVPVSNGSHWRTAMKIRALVVDDEPLARQRLRLLLSEEGDLEIVGECEDGIEAVAQITASKPDLLFLDVQMPEMDGFEVLGKVPREMLPIVIFTTAYDEHALRAFDAHALDYLLKPFKPERLKQAVQRARELIANKQAGATTRGLLELLSERPTATNYLSRLAVKTPDRVIFVNVEEIDAIEAAGKYAVVHVGKENHVLRETMNSLESNLPPDRFLRISRSVIVNIARVQELQPMFKGENVIVLKNGKRYPTTRLFARSRKNSNFRSHFIEVDPKFQALGSKSNASSAKFEHDRPRQSK